MFSRSVLHSMFRRRDQKNHMKLTALSPSHCQHLRNIVFLNNVFHLPVSSYSLMQNLLLSLKILLCLLYCGFRNARVACVGGVCFLISVAELFELSGNTQPWVPFAPALCLCRNHMSQFHFGPLLRNM